VPLNASNEPDVPTTRPAETTGSARVGPTTAGSDGTDISGDELTGSAADKTGLYALEKADLFNLLCVPPPAPGAVGFSAEYLTTLSEALSYCVRRRAVLLVDSDPEWGPDEAADASSTLGLTGVAARNAAVYFPWLRKSDPLLDFQISDFAPSGAVAGVIARTDAQRGVWKAPAGTDAAISGVAGLQVSLTDGENGDLNPLGVNVLRSFPVYGRVVWGARTMRGADQAADEYKYLPVRRTALFIEESLYRGTQWVVFEPNDEPLWSQIRLNVGAFMHDLFRQGAFQGKTPAEAYLVKCDKTTTTQSDINRGVVNILVGFAPLKPAEFVIIKIQQLAGQVEA
jgi:phage tail sheath protein FI